MFLHRAPTTADEEAAEKDVGQDVFGRPRSSLPPDDHTGTGALVRECRALYLNWGKGAAPPGFRHTVEAEARAFGPVLRTHVMAEAPVAFVEFETRASAEFAKEALSRQALPGTPPTAAPLLIRWALDDPNPATATRKAAAVEAAIVAGVKRAVAGGGGEEGKRARLAEVHASYNLRAPETVAAMRAAAREFGRRRPAPAAVQDAGAWSAPAVEEGAAPRDPGASSGSESDGDADAGLGGDGYVPTPGGFAGGGDRQAPPPPPADGGDPAAAAAAGWALAPDGTWTLAEEGGAGAGTGTMAAAAVAGEAAALAAIAGYASDTDGD